MFRTRAGMPARRRSHALWDRDTTDALLLPRHRSTALKSASASTHASAMPSLRRTRGLAPTSAAERIRFARRHYWWTGSTERGLAAQELHAAGGRKAAPMWLDGLVNSGVQRVLSAHRLRRARAWRTAVVGHRRRSSGQCSRTCCWCSARRSLWAASDITTNSSPPPPSSSPSPFLLPPVVVLALALPSTSG